MSALREDHRIDGDGNPAGGSTIGTGIEIHWQEGPLGRGAERLEPNGAFCEDVIRAAIGRLRFYNEGGSPGGRGKFACRENSLAITHLEEALHWCLHRTSDREARQVEGTHAL